MNNEIELKFLELAGVETLEEVLDVWESERMALAEIYDQNAAFGILNARLLVCAPHWISLCSWWMKWGRAANCSCPRS